MGVSVPEKLLGVKVPGLGQGLMLGLMFGLRLGLILGLKFGDMEGLIAGLELMLGGFSGHGVPGSILRDIRGGSGKGLAFRALG